jgi:type I restriction enzyme, R subunit
LESTDDYIPNIKGGVGRKEKKQDPLSVIIDKVNERFGTAFTELDKVLEQMKADFAKDEKMANAAKSNDKSLFKYLYEQRFKDAKVRYILTVIEGIFYMIFQVYGKYLTQLVFLQILI